MKLVVLVVAAVLAVVATVPSTASADATPAVVLVSAGRGAKQRLRLTPTEGAKYTLVMTSQESKARGIDGKLGAADVAPLIRTTLNVEVTDVTTEGDVHYAFAYAKVDVVPDKRTKPDVVKVYQAAFGVAVAIKGTAVVTSRGVVKKVDIETPAGTSPELGTAIEAARTAMMQVSQPLPAEEVGVGATWQTTSQATIGEISADTKVSYQVLSLAKSKVKLAVTIHVTGKGQGDGNLTTDTAGSGEAELDLASPLPTRSRATLRTEVGLDADGHRLAQVSTTKMTIQTK